MKLTLFAVAMIAVPSAALRVSPLATRRNAIIAGASVVPAIVLPKAAHADAIEEIARKNAIAAQEAAEQKKKAEEQKALLAAADSGFNGVLTVGILGVLALIATESFMVLTRCDNSRMCSCNTIVVVW